MQYTCKTCNFCTDNSKCWANHIRWYHKLTKDTEEYRSYIQKVSKIKSKPIKYIKEEILRKCPECNKLYKTIQKTNKDTGEISYQRKYCSITCANKQGSKHVDYNKVSEWAKNNPRGWCTEEWRNEYMQTEECQWRSKRENEIVSYFKENFKNDEWTHGCIYKKLCPDLWSRKLKVVIEYDGIWHFKDIHGQLERKQQNDRDVLKYCKDNGYRLIRIDEDLKLSIDDIINAVYNDNKELELFNSTRYEYLF